MALERKWLAVNATPFTADGTSLGVITVADTAGLKVKQLVFIAATGQPLLQLQVKRVLSNTQLIVGPPNNKIDPNQYQDVSAYTMALAATIAAPEQNKNNIPGDDHYSAIYESDPTVADRIVLVDQYGRFYGESNPIPIVFDGTVSIGDVEIKGPSGHYLDPNTDGSINVNIVETPVVGQVEKSIYNEITSVASGVQTQIVSYTVPFAKTAILHRIVTSGENVARYDLFLNGTPFDTQRTYFGGNFNALFEFITGTNAGFVLNSGDVLSVKVLHARPFVGSFESRIQVLEIS